MLVLYGVAKGCEAADGFVDVRSGGLIAGHALKHLAAAAACLLLVEVARRSPIDPAPVVPPLRGSVSPDRNCE